MKYHDEILDIYVDVCSSGVMEQHLDMAEEEKAFNHIFQSGGYGYIVFDAKKVVGFVFAIPLAYDSLLPDSIKKRFPVDKSLKVAEMHVHRDYRGRGIGSRLLKKLIDDIDRTKWDHLFIRAWKDNVGAMKLYQRFGFKPDEIISQEKKRMKTKEKFMIQKQYLYQNLK